MDQAIWIEPYGSSHGGFFFCLHELNGGRGGVNASARMLQCGHDRALRSHAWCRVASALLKSTPASPFIGVPRWRCAEIVRPCQGARSSLRSPVRQPGRPRVARKHASRARRCASSCRSRRAAPTTCWRANRDRIPGPQSARSGREQARWRRQHCLFVCGEIAARRPHDVDRAGLVHHRPHLSRNPGYHPVNDFAPISQVIDVPFVLVVPPTCQPGRCRSSLRLRNPRRPS